MQSGAEQGTRAGQTPIWVPALAAVLVLCCGCGAEVKGHVDGPLPLEGGRLPLPTVRQVVGDEVALAAARCVGDTGEVAVFNPGGAVTLGRP